MVDLMISLVPSSMLLVPSMALVITLLNSLVLLVQRAIISQVHAVDHPLGHVLVQEEDQMIQVVT
jgi:hypothetical protein